MQQQSERDSGVSAESITTRLKELKRLKATTPDFDDRVLRIYLEAERRLHKIDRGDKEKARLERIEPAVQPAVQPVVAPPPRPEQPARTVRPDTVRHRVAPSQRALAPDAHAGSQTSTAGRYFPNLPAHLPSIAWVRRELAEGATPVFYRILDAYALEDLSCAERLYVAVVIPRRSEDLAAINDHFDRMVLSDRYRPVWEGRRVYFRFVYS